MLARDAVGNLYFDDHGAKAIQRVSPAGVVTRFASLPTSGVPLGLAFDRAGNLFVGLGDADVIERIAPDGTATPFATLPAGSTPLGLAFDAAGNLYASHLVADNVRKITPAGAVSVFATLPTNTQPVGLAFDEKGTLYEAGVDGVINKISPAGVVTPFVRNDFPVLYLALTDDAGNPLAVPVPEPGAASIVLLAAGAAGMSRRRPSRP